MSQAIVVGIAVIVAAGAIWKIFRSIPRATLFFLGGLVIGITLLITA